MIDMNAIVLLTNALYFTQTDGAEKIDSDGDGEMDYYAGNSHDFIIGATEQISLIDGVLQPTTTNDVDLGTSSLLFKDIWLVGKAQFYDSAIGIYSQADTFLDLFADGAVRIGDSSGGAPTNYSYFAPDGHLNMVGTAKAYREVTFVPNYRNITAQGKPTLVSRGAFFGFSLPIYAADDEELFSCRCIDTCWDGITDPVILIGGWLDTANTSKKFKLQVSVEAIDMSSNDVVPTTTTDYTVETTTGTWAQYTSFIAQVTIDASAIGLLAGQPLAIRIRRIAASADEIAGEVVVEGFAMQFVADKIGGAT